MARPPQNKKSESLLSQAAEPRLNLVFPVVLGSFFGLCLLKFSNPPIMEKYVDRPSGAFEAMATNPWPIAWGYALLVAMAIFCVALLLLDCLPPFDFKELRRLFAGPDSPKAMRVLLVAPLVWLGWQFLSSRFTLSHELSNQTVAHYAACVACFYLGFLGLGSQKNLWPFFVPILVAFVLVLAVGFDQHFGGLREMRESVYKEMQLYPEKTYPPEFIKKLATSRIFSTLFYPNTLAGALLLFAPAMLLAARQAAERWRLGNASRGETVTVLIVISLACVFLYILNSRIGLAFVLLFGLSLVFPVPRMISPAILGCGILLVLFWSGSKAGWLLTLALVVLFVLSVPFKRLAMSPRLKIALIVAFMCIGITGFFVRYAGFFKKGATSVSARFDYWHAAVQTAATHPLVGTGPGTFQIPYSRLKRPESEMARLAHNDYLQQASDSGFFGALLYAGFIAGGLAIGWRLRGISDDGTGSASNASFLIWLGVLGWAAQCFVEFSLQIPALAWPAFAFLGHLCASMHKTPKPGPI